MEDAVVAGGGQHGARAHGRPGGARPSPRRCGGHPVHEPGGMGAGRFCHLLRGRHDHSHLSDVPPRPHRIHRQRRGGEDPDRGRPHPARQGPRSGQVHAGAGAHRDHAGLRGARAVPADIHLGGAAAPGPGKGRLPQGRAREAGGRHHARGRRHHRLHLRHHRTAQGRGADPRQSLVRPGVRGPDHLDIGGRRPPALPAPRALLRAARVLHRRTPRALHRLCREHRQASGEPP